MNPRKVVLFANTDWYLYHFRLSFASRLRDEGYEVVLLSPEGQYSERLIELGFRWHAVPMHRRSLNPLRELRLILWLAEFLARERAGIIHGFTIKGAVYGALAAKLASVPVRINAIDGMGYVFTSNGIKARVLRPMVRQVMRLAFRGGSSALILQNPDDVALFMQARIVDKEAVRVVRGAGVDFRRFMPRQETTGGEAAPLRVLLAARLIREKGIEDYAEAARILKHENRTIRFLLAGAPDEGNPTAIGLDVVRRWTEEGLVEWLGHVHDMPALLSNVDVVALPSYYREGLPTTLVEGAACALPLITTDGPGCREVVSRNGEDGLIVPARDARALADAIRLLDDDRALARKLGLAAHEKGLREFDERVVLDKLLTTYRELGTLRRRPPMMQSESA
ncbi:glycosyltransferase family 4 protein [Caballeronia sp. LZ035]|uniref:glycosyltransferase family 4 protein n=1 Tax=Caballeronia sp. LZ035 TaxID=3038568 RepID=UPI00285DE633|nr:glycosyltransferase family 4 protein [Caballeronia sp. LZ035]MDR5759821.1 glycosyltransferase family 4 protein [Caballeronia sp. LZ035]